MSAGPGLTSAAEVTSISSTIGFGLYNPYTENGFLIVDGVLASAHSELTFDDWAPAFMVPYLPVIYQTAFKPFYLAYKVLGAEVAQSIRPETWTLDGSFMSFHNMLYAALAMGVVGAVVKSSGSKLCAVRI
ncbi:hypothetical protein WJX73_002540 [Symbiochloris irregularis]|uniref:Hedgehog protein Hint domain-containing protein n=1 Tax=Symbiochloris irregularis TaxID=706552 RepID=A0AAW1NK81_9CHLO